MPVPLSVGAPHHQQEGAPGLHQWIARHGRRPRAQGNRQPINQTRGLGGRGGGGLTGNGALQRARGLADGADPVAQRDSLAAWQLASVASQQVAFPAP